jgi:hypothetical protein
MYRRPILPTFHIAVDFLIVLYKGLYGWGDRAGHSKLTSYQMALALLIAISGPKIAYTVISGPTPSNGPRNGFSRIKTVTSGAI